MLAQVTLFNNTLTGVKTKVHRLESLWTLLKYY